MKAGCYTLDLYCDNAKTDASGVDPIHGFDAFPVQIIRELGSKCRRIARSQGWTLSKEKDLCPLCSEKKSSKR